VELTKTAVRGLAPQFTVAPVTKFVPVTVKVNAAPPEVALAGDSEVSVGTGFGALIVVGSLTVSLAVFVSPPPETVAVFVTLAAALLATLTASVIAG
jgi:hypothetical protein